MANKTLSDVIDRLKAEGQLTRNSGKNSIKTIKEILVEQNSSSLEDKELRREESLLQSRQLDALEIIASNSGQAGNIELPESSGGGGLFGGLLGGGIGGALAGIGIGGGALAAGIGIMAAGGGYLLNEIGEMDADAIVDKVNTLLSIGDSFTGGNWGFLLEGAPFALAMTGIGLGLAAFSVGAGAAAAIDYFTSGRDWSQSIKDNVITLMSISDELGGNMAFIGDSATFLLSMTGIAAGLAVFGAGSAVGAAVDYFTSGTDWAQSIKDNIMILMSIEDALGGKLSTFGEAGTFFAVMSGLGLGLAAFGFGQGATGVAEAINKFAGEGDFADRIKSQVETLMSITDNVDTAAATDFAASMGIISGGLTAFAAGQFVGTLANAAEAILGFFTGSESPFDQIMDVAENADNLEKGADAVEKIARALDSFAGIRINDIELDFEKMAQDLAEAIPLLQGLAQGGEVGEGFFDGPNIDFGRGILDPSLRLDELASATGQINYILSGGANVPDAEMVIPDITARTAQVRALSEEQSVNDVVRDQPTPTIVQGGNTVVAPQDNSSTVVNRGGDVNINDRMMDPHNPDDFRDMRR